MLGVVLLGMIGPALTFLGVSAYWERAIQGAIILTALLFDALRGAAGQPSRRRSRRPAHDAVRAQRRVDPAGGTASPRSWSSRRSRRSSPRVGNFFEITRLSVELGLLAIALTPVLITGGIDLSVGSMMGLAAVMFGVANRDWGLPIPAAIGVSLDDRGRGRRR